MTARSIAALALASLPLACASPGNPLRADGRSAPVILSYERPSPVQPYGGKEVCRRCHSGIYSFWKGTAHARSFENLTGPGDDRRPSCLRCHTTGYGERTGFADGESTPSLAAVTCESCHGAAGDHAASRHPGLVSASNGDDCSSCEVSRICRRCHTPSRSPGFRLDRDLASVSCRDAAAAGEGDELLTRKGE